MADVIRMADTIEMVNIPQCLDLQTPSLEFELSRAGEGLFHRNDGIASDLSLMVLIIKNREPWRPGITAPMSPFLSSSRKGQNVRSHCPL